MKICVVSDEVSTDPETAFEIIRSWGVDYVELRGIGDARYPCVSDYWHYRIPELLREFDLKVAALSPGLFQSEYPKPVPPTVFNRRDDIRQVARVIDARAAVERDMREVLPQSIDAARNLGAKSIICFNFMRMDHKPSPSATDEMINLFREAADMVGAAGMQLLVEVSEPSARPADILRRADHPAMAINWDPGAAFLGGEDKPYPDGFAQLRRFIRHVHFKDVRVDPQSGKREVVLNGVIDWKNAFRDLAADGFDGFVSVETHFRPKVAGTRGCIDRVRALLDEVQQVVSEG